MKLKLKPFFVVMLAAAAIILCLIAVEFQNIRSNMALVGGIGDVKRSYFNKPDILYVYEATEIQYLIDQRNSAIVNRLFDKVPGDIDSRNVQVGELMTAKLTAPPEMLEISPADDKLRKYSDDEPTIWRWYVTPKKTGIIPVVLEAFIVDQKPDGPVRSYLVMREHWNTEARGANWYRYHLTNIEPLRAALWTLGGGLGSLLVFFGWTGWKRGSTTPEKPRKRKK